MSLETSLLPASAIVRSLDVDAEHPWLGLLPYKEEHRDFFFGRDREIEDIVGRIRDNSLTILYGQSGLGKSSILAAGVVPRLREAGYAPRWVRLSFTDGPKSQTLVQQTLALASAALGTLTPSDFDERSELQRSTLWERFHHRSAPVSPVPVLIFDQFEEIFTLGSQCEQQVAEWRDQVADLLQNRPPRYLVEKFAQDPTLADQYQFDDAPIRIVFALREDYLAHLERWKAPMPLLMQNRMSLSLLTGPQARQAVLGPAQLGEDSLVSREVAESIVRTVARVPIDTPLDQIKAVPPLLSLLCEQLNAARISSKSQHITADSVRDQADDILQRFYVDSFLSFPEEHRSRIRALLEDPPMITEGGFRNNLDRDDAERQLSRAGVADAKSVFDTLIQRRLITTETRDGRQRLEITHDVLVPLLVHSRKERQDREAKEAAEHQLTEQVAKARIRRLITSTMAGLTILALVAAWYGLYQASKAEASAKVAAEQQAIANEAAENAKRSFDDTIKARTEIEQLVQYLMKDLAPALQGKAATKYTNDLERKVVTYYEKTAGIDPSIDRCRALVARIRTLVSQGSAGEAEKMARAAIDFAVRLPGQKKEPDSQFILASCHGLLGRSLTIQHRFSEARQAFDEQQAIFKALIATTPDVSKSGDIFRFHMDIAYAASELDVAKLLLLDEKYLAAADRAQTATTVLSTLKETIAQDSTAITPHLRLALDHDLASTHHVRALGLERAGWLHRLNKGSSSAIEPMREAQRVMTEVIRRNLQNGDWQCDWATIEIDNLRLIEKVRNRFKDAKERDLNLPQIDDAQTFTRLTEAIEVVKALSDADSENQAWKAKLASLFRAIGRMQADKGSTKLSGGRTKILDETKIRMAKDYYKNAIALLKPLVATHDENAVWKYELYDSLWNLGKCFRELRDIPEAQTSYADALEIAEGLQKEGKTARKDRLDAKQIADDIKALPR